MEHLTQSRFVVGHPAARAQCSQRLAHLYLVTTVTAAFVFVGFVLCGHVQFAEHLFERLHQLCFEHMALPSRPLARCVQMVRVNDGKRRFGVDVLRAIQGEKLTIGIASYIVVLLHQQLSKERRDDGVLFNHGSIGRHDGGLLSHHVLKNRASTAILQCPVFVCLVHLQVNSVFLELRGHRFQWFIVFLNNEFVGAISSNFDANEIAIGLQSV